MIDKNTPRYLNQDSDYSMTTRNEMTDAKNIRVSLDESGNGGVIKNIKGNSAISLASAMPSGDNLVVGVYDHSARNELYFFVWNENENHSVWRYNPQISATASKVVESDALDFYPDTQLNIDAVIVDEDVHLYFTDGISEPKKINVGRQGTYPIGATKEERLIDLAVAKQPNLENISASWATDATVNTNNLYGKAFQFAVQFEYADGEVSALGHYSPLLVAPNTINQINKNEDYKKLYNKVSLSVDAPTTAIVSVRWFFRVDNSAFYFIDETEPVANTATLDFYNDKAYAAISNDEFNKLTDAVPQLAKAQTISDNRLVYGNYLEGFDVGDVTASLSVNYSDIPPTYVIPVDITPRTNRIEIRYDLTNIPATNIPDANVLLLYNISPIDVVHDVNQSYDFESTSYGAFTDTTVKIQFYTDEYSFYETFPIAAQSTRALWGAALANEISSRDYPFTHSGLSATYATEADDVAAQQTWDVYYNGNVTFETEAAAYVSSATNNPFINSPVVNADLKLSSYSMKATKGVLIADVGDPSNPDIGQNDFGFTSEVSFTNSTDDALDLASMSANIEDNVSLAEETGYDSTFKTLDSHAVGVVYVDNRGRTSGVQELGSVTVDPLGDSARSSNNGAAHIDISFSTSPPSWADKFFFVYNGGSRYNKYVQYTVAEAFIPFTTAADYTYDTEDNVLFLSLRTLQGKQQSYTESDDGIGLQYTFTDGDKLRIVEYQDPNGTVYPEGYEFEVLGLHTFDDYTTSPVHATIGSTEEKNFRKTGTFLAIKPKDIALFDKGSVGGGVDFWGNRCVVEIYSEIKDTVDIVYYAASDMIDVANHGNTHTLRNGNAWYVSRLLKSKKVRNGELVNYSAKDLEYYPTYVESMSYFDASSGKSFSNKGKPYAKIENERAIWRTSSLTYSEPYLQDSSRLWLSSFNNSLGNWMDIDIANGGIYGLVGTSQSIMVLQEDKVGVIPTNKNILQTASSDTMISLNTEFLGNIQYYEGNFGIGTHRGAFIQADERVFVFDAQHGSVYQLTEGGVSEISVRGMRSYFEALGKDLTDYMDAPTGVPQYGDGRNLVRITMGHDRGNNEVVISSVKGVEQASKLPEATYYPVVWDYTGSTIAFDYDMNQWASFHDVTCDAFGTMANRFFHFKSVGASPMWEAETNATRSNFFGVQEDAYFETVFNAGKFNRKVYQAVSIDGDAKGSVDISTKTQSATIAEAAFSLREDEYFASCPRAAGNDEYITLGVVSNIQGSNLIFSSRINRMPFRLGGDVYKYSGGSFSSASATVTTIVDTHTITVSSAAGVVIGDTIAIKAASVIDGDPLRGAWAKMKFNFDDTDGFEILAVNASIADSKLHNVSQATEQ